MGKTLRQQIKHHIDKKDADYKAGWAPDPTWTITTEGGTVPTTWGEWKNSLLREKRWICHRTLQAAANRLGVHITVLVDDGTNATPIQLRAKSSTKDCIVLHLHNKHYRPVIPDSTKPWPTHWVQETDTTSQVPRAGMDVTPRRITKTDPRLQYQQPQTHSTGMDAIKYAQSTQIYTRFIQHGKKQQI